jgi:2-polyprenyl-3-methyl-5-hydroxy-6-metoxy-1,4-benzoquinol methylase
MAQIVTNKAILDHYAEMAQSYDRAHGLIHRVIHKWMEKNLPAASDAPLQILDAGAGTGATLKFLAARYPNAELTGLDLSPTMLEHAAHSVPQAHLKLCDLAYEELPPEHYDIVVSMRVLHELNDPMAHIFKLVNATKSGGTIILCDIAVAGIIMKLNEKHARRFDLKHKAAYTLDELHEIVKSLPVTIKGRALLRPDMFWRYQIFALTKV